MNFGLKSIPMSRYRQEIDYSLWPQSPSIRIRGSSVAIWRELRRHAETHFANKVQDTESGTPSRKVSGFLDNYSGLYPDPENGGSHCTSFRMWDSPIQRCCLLLSSSPRW